MPSLSKQCTLLLGPPVALHHQVVKPMEEAILENLSNLANLVLTYRNSLMIAEDLDFFSITGIALILALLAARIIKRNRGIFKFFRVWRAAASGRPSRGERTPALKPCPNCAEQLPPSAIICEICDYNFLAERPGRGQKLLPSPNT